MSTTLKVSAGVPVSASAPREHVWTAALILGVIAACAIGAGFYLEAPILDTSMVVAP